MVGAADPVDRDTGRLVHLPEAPLTGEAARLLTIGLAEIAAAVAVLRGRIGARPAVAVGFCFGGTHAFLAGANRGLDLDAVVGFYGRLSPGRLPKPAARASNFGVPLLGLFGGDDPSIPAEEIEEFHTALRRAGVGHQLVTYPDAPHSFFDRASAEHMDACRDCWHQVLDFLEGLRVPAP